MNYPRISVVIPAHNEEKTISPTLVAVLAQEYPNFEIIVINNASSDRTMEVASQFPVKVITETRKGLLWARDRGRIEASGDIIANIDADCLPEKDWLTRGVAHFSHDDIVAATGPYDYYDGGILFRSMSLGMQKYIYYPVSLILQHPKVKKGAVLIGGNNFIRNDTIRKAGGYNTSIIFYGEDTDTAKRISKHGKVIFNPSLTMKTSARRFKEEGFATITVKYLYYFFKTIFTKKY